MARKIRRAARSSGRGRSAARGGDAGPTLAGGREQPARVPVVGIGASAGGLDAFRRFFGAMPADSGMAFVLVQHLDPTHESLTPTLVGRYTSMPVVQVAGDTPVEPNHVYVIPPGKYLTVSERTLRLTVPVEPGGVRLAIDFFLRSLAADVQERAIGIILSGTGTDGTLGLKAIKGAGGLALAQEPKTAQHDGMPRSAIATGAVDHVLPAEQMPDVMIGYVQHPYVGSARDAAAPVEIAHDHVSDVLAILRDRMKFDFRSYKRSTLERRVQRRMSLRHVAQGANYVRLLKGDLAEIRALFDDLLIGVTSFFRDPEAWHLLDEHVLRALAERRESQAALRVWVAGCGTGEEAYSVAMLLLEAQQAGAAHGPVQVFASDVDVAALGFARVGLYPQAVVGDLTPARIAHFFTREDHSYRVNRALREAVVFAQQNLLTDPPFSKLDVILCRNVLMYVEPEAQQRVISLLHFALNEGGYLFLGSAETAGRQEDLFEVISKRWRIYRRVGPTRPDRVRFRAQPPLARPNLGRPAGLLPKLLLERYAPACVVINRKHEILYFSGPSGEYLTQPAGPPTQDLMAWAREGMQTRLRTAIHRAIRDGKTVTVTGAHVRRGDAVHRVKLVVEPFPGGGETDGLLLVAFADEPSAAVPTAVAPEGEPETRLVRQLEDDLKTTRDELQSSVDELQASNQELNVANEEVMSVNEELRAANEELETSKEELESINEELNTVNAQLEAKVVELKQANDDLDNLLISTNIPTIFLDGRFHVRRFTPAATNLFHLIPSDVGRSLGDITRRCTDEDVLSDAGVVLAQLAPITKEVQGHDGRRYVRQILPYRTRDDRIEGVVITFSDVAAEALQEARLYAEAIVDTVREPLLVLDANLRVQSANQSFYQTFRVSTEEAVDRSLYELGNYQWDSPRLRELLGEILARRKVLSDFEVTHEFERIGRRTMVLNARTLSRGGGRLDLILLAIEDVTDRKHAERTLHESEARTRAGVDTAVDAIITIDESGTVLSFNPAAERIFGYAAGDMLGQSAQLIILPPYGNEHDPSLASYLRRERRVLGIGREVSGRRQDGTAFPLDLTISEFDDGNGRKFVGTVRDITARKQAEEQLRRHQADLAHVLRVSTIERLAAGLAHDLNQPLAAIANDVEACAAQVRSGKGKRGPLLELLDRAGAEALRAGEIVHRLREFVQRGQPHLEPVDLREVIRNATRWVAREVEQAHIVLRIDLGARPLSLHADRVQIEQVILNILQNAVDAIREAEGAEREVYVRTSRTADGLAEVTVYDTGCGVSEAVAERLFEAFFTTKAHGLGMGLAISRSIVEAHNGRLSVERHTPDPGTTVRLVLPMDLVAGFPAERHDGG
jgi:two-component system CheB/CheR fusion protein